uniref:Alliin lyase n=1 Tax=Zea mays TaxID=4577 RepID=B6TK37_MAIZE|nr:alliin lyase precursor [Zea mays]
MAGAGAGAGAGALAGLAACATLACNVAGAVLFLLSQDDERLRRGCAARLGAGGVASQPVEECGDEEALAPDAVLNLELGDPTMYRAFWREVGDCGATLIRGCQGMSYFSDDDAVLCWFLEPELEREVRRLHRIVGNAVVDGYHLVVGTGATQLYQAAMYALSSPARRDQPVPVVSPAPYYSSYPPQTDLLLSDFYRWAGDANTFTGDECIELVCSPNNPDGAIREAVVRSAGAKAIHDLVYYWPQYTPITGAAAHDIMLFSVSKLTGHAGTRLGWALVKDREVARNMVYFVDRSTTGVCKESQMRATKILGVVSDAYEVVPPARARASGAVPRLFDFALRRLEERWRILRATVAATGAFSLPEETSGYCNFAKQTVTACPAFAWLRCEKEGVEDCAELLAGHNIVGSGGEQFGGDARCVRINMLDRDNVFDMLVQRLSSIN